MGKTSNANTVSPKLELTSYVLSKYSSRNDKTAVLHKIYFFEYYLQLT